MKQEITKTTPISCGKRNYRPVKEIFQDLYGYTPASTSITRWQAQGFKTARIGKWLCSTDELVIAFVEGGERIAPPSIEKQRSEAATAKALEQVDRDLAAEGI
jgi:hypothetical protein